MQREPIEKYTVLLKRLGYSAAFGKIFGYLISAEPPQRTFDQIVRDLGLSKGAVSMVLRTMEDHGYVDYVIPVGERKRHYRISTGKWKQGLQQKIDDSEQFSELLRESLAQCGPKYRQHRANIARLLAFEEVFQSKLKEIIRTFGRPERGKRS